MYTEHEQTYSLYFERSPNSAKMLKVIGRVDVIANCGRGDRPLSTYWAPHKKILHRDHTFYLLNPSLGLHNEVGTNSDARLCALPPTIFTSWHI